MLIESLQEFWEKYRIQIIIGGLVIGILGFLFLPGIGGRSNEQQPMTDIRPMSISQRSKKSQAEEMKSLATSTGDVYVDIKGAVHHPGAISNGSPATRRGCGSKSGRLYAGSRSQSGQPCAKNY